MSACSFHHALEHKMKKREIFALSALLTSWISGREVKPGYVDGLVEFFSEVCSSGHEGASVGIEKT
jgi:hypothetical protein